MGDTKYACKARVGKTGRKRPLGRAKLTWEDNNKMDQEVRWGGGTWTELMWHSIGTSGGLL
jgi:hypothetical protein